MEKSYTMSYKGIKDKALFMLKKQLNPVIVNMLKE